MVACLPFRKLHFFGSGFGGAGFLARALFADPDDHAGAFLELRGPCAIDRLNKDDGARPLALVP